VQRIAEGVDATATVFFHKDGVVVESHDVIAWGERRKYIQLAAEYGGYVPSGRSSEVSVTASSIFISGIAKPKSTQD
jgi:hypothetical protein